MQSNCHGEHSSGVMSFLPMVELNPSDETCLYSTLLYVIDPSQQLGIVIPLCIGLWRAYYTVEFLGGQLAISWLDLV